MAPQGWEHPGGKGHQGDGAGDGVNQDWGKVPMEMREPAVLGSGYGLAGKGHQGDGAGDGVNQDWGGPNSDAVPLRRGMAIRETALGMGSIRIGVVPMGRMVTYK